MDFNYLFTATRARVYLLWACLVPAGFVATHFYQKRLINAVWTVIAIVGLGYMWKVLYLKIPQMRNIFLAWTVPILLGMGVSGAVFYIDTYGAFWLMVHLGAFWLGIMAIGYFLNGLVDPPRFWYFLNVCINLTAAVLCFTVPAFAAVQYLIAAVVSAWSMLNLWLFRSDA
jgi:hypothetical protein